MFSFMYAIGEMHQVISETYTLIWAAKQKIVIQLLIKNSKLTIVNLIFCAENCIHIFHI